MGGLKKIPIVAFRKDGRKIKRFPSIGHFRIFSNKKYKMDGASLKKLRRGELIFWNPCIIGLASKYGHGRRKKIDPSLCSYLHRKKNTAKDLDKSKAIRNLIDIYYKFEKVLIIDTNFKVLEIYAGTLKALAKRDKVPLGTIKASLSKTPFKRVNSRRKGIKYYVYLSDLFAFLENNKNG